MTTSTTEEPADRTGDGEPADKPIASAMATDGETTEYWMLGRNWVAERCEFASTSTCRAVLFAWNGFGSLTRVRVELPEGYADYRSGQPPVFKGLGSALALFPPALSARVQELLGVPLPWQIDFGRAAQLVYDSRR